MGAEQSREHINATIRATADELQKAPSATIKIPGRLPSYKAHTGLKSLENRLRAARTRRPLQTRPPGIYHPAGTASPSSKRHLEDAPPISPLKRQRAAKTVANADTSLPARDQQITDDQHEDGAITTNTHAGEADSERTSSRQSAQKPTKGPQQAHVGPSTNATQAQPGAKERSDAPREQPVFDFTKDSEGHTGPPTLQRRGRGRPPKHGIPDDEVQVIEPAVKRKRGRPRKDTNGAAQEEELHIDATSILEKGSAEQTTIASHAPYVPPDVDDEGPTKEQRAKSSATHATKQSSTRAQRQIDKANRVQSTTAPVEAIESVVDVKQDVDGEKTANAEQPEDEFTPPSDGSQAASKDGAESDDEAQLPTNPLVRNTADHLNLSSLKLGGNSKDVQDRGEGLNQDGDENADEDVDEDADGDVDGGEDEDEDEEPTKGRKRKVSSRNTANTQRQRATKRFRSPTPEFASSSRTAAPSATQVDRQRLFGQWHILQEVFEARHSIGVSTTGGRRSRCNIVLIDQDIKAIVDVCDGAIETMSEGEDTEAATHDLRKAFNDIGGRVDGLYNHIDGIGKVDDARKVNCIYFHLFPKLVELVERTLIYYEKMDRSTGTRNSISRRHLETLCGLVKIIIDLGAGVMRYENPASSLSLVRPVKNDIVSPLKTVNTAFDRVILHMLQSEERRDQAERDAIARVKQAEEEAREADREAHVRRMRNKWNTLHTKRRFIEGGIMRKAKSDHLLCHEPAIELDQNGHPFERVEVFAPRVGPPNALVKLARERLWPNHHVAALAEGLEKYSGDHVFEKVIDSYCSPRRVKGVLGPLTGYSVTEIVVMAADLKVFLTAEQMREQGEIARWVKAIPEWVAGRPLGTENQQPD